MNGTHAPPEFLLEAVVETDAFTKALAEYVRVKKETDDFDGDGRGHGAALLRRKVQVVQAVIESCMHLCPEALEEMRHHDYFAD